jgi:hypothetical protein
MSKMDALRALREARYDQERAAGTKSAGTKPAAPRAARPPATRDDAADAGVADDPESAATALCGHRSMNGRTCTREAGHSAKNHRYS